MSERGLRARRGALGARALLACLALAAGPPALAEEPALSCQARRTADRVVASVDLARLVSEETRRLIQLGMKGSVEVEGTVVRRRWRLFEETVATVSTRAVLSAAADGRTLLLNGRPLVPGAKSIPLDRVAFRLSGREKPDEALTFRASIELRVVTASSLAKVAAWATESSEEEASSSLVTRALLQAVASDLTRTGECASAVTGR